MLCMEGYSLTRVTQVVTYRRVQISGVEGAGSAGSWRSDHLGCNCISCYVLLNQNRGTTHNSIINLIGKPFWIYATLQGFKGIAGKMTNYIF